MFCELWSETWCSQKSRADFCPRTLTGVISLVLFMVLSMMWYLSCMCMCGLPKATLSFLSAKMHSKRILVELLVVTSLSLFPRLFSCFLLSTAIILKITENCPISLQRHKWWGSFALRRKIQCSVVQKTLMCPIFKTLAWIFKGIFQYILACSGRLTLISSHEQKCQTQMMKV